jgi:hypothetical protein
LVSYNGKSDWIGKETNFNNRLFFQASSHQPVSVEVFAAVRQGATLVQGQRIRKTYQVKGSD